MILLDFFLLQDLVGLVISILLFADFSLVLLTLLQLYSFSMADIFLVLFVLPMGILSPFPAGINALFSHGPRRSAGLARVYALWNITSLVNVVSGPTAFPNLQFFLWLRMTLVLRMLVLSNVYLLAYHSTIVRICCSHYGAIKPYLSLLFYRLWLLYAGLYITSHQAKNIRAYNHGVWQRKLVFLPFVSCCT